ncbi:hypothetical protein F2Q68_00038224 [Brassica cretica]|uniref:Uncharacterized protein n=1 Tax=Brassica cretica TaxID=69181 RepID=A0A8S9MJG8_BRACR|nr:hypothetical protein F2Q68_00038224 [Brassica cretica]
MLLSKFNVFYLVLVSPLSNLGEPQTTKGTVTPLASLFSEEEARKAATYVLEKIREKREEMNHLQHFVDENDNLINLVTKLPDQLRHNVMASFATMRLGVHQLLGVFGRDYYTDRTSKETRLYSPRVIHLKLRLKIFNRRLPSSLQLLQKRRYEVVLEIREEYEEEDSSATVLQPSGVNPGGEGEAGEGEVEVEEDEFARIMSKLNELEMEAELEGEDGDDYKGEDQDSSGESVEESEHVVVFDLRDKSNHNRIGDEESAAKQESTISVLEKSPIQKSEPKFDTNNKAFTGSIVEHAHNLQTNTHGLMQGLSHQNQFQDSRHREDSQSGSMYNFVCGIPSDDM